MDYEKLASSWNHYADTCAAGKDAPHQKASRDGAAICSFMLRLAIEKPREADVQLVRFILDGTY